MIKSFADEQTRRVFSRERVPTFGPELQRAAWKKLAILHAVGSLQDLRVPPGNRLERLVGGREGQYSFAEAAEDTHKATIRFVKQPRRAIAIRLDPSDVAKIEAMTEAKGLSHRR